MADHLKTPARVTGPIHEFCREIEPACMPSYVDVERSSDAQLNECFGNVAAAVAEHGGGTQHGWVILEWPSVYLEAQFHAVWVRPDGALLDVSTQDESRVLFLPDTHLTFRRQRTPSKQRALRDEKKIHEFIGACHDIWAFESSHWYDDGVVAGVDRETSMDVVIYWDLENRQMNATSALYRRLGLIP